MSRRCPHCGFYNTDRKVGDTIGKGILDVGSGIITLVATFGSELLSRGTGKITPNNVRKVLKLRIDCFHCNVCGIDFYPNIEV